MYSPILLRVWGIYRSLSSLEAALAQTQEILPDWLNHFIWAPFNPLLVDAFKTIAYEIALSQKVPDCIFIPVAGGDLLSGLYKGFQELQKMGQLQRPPRLVAVQGEGADPTVQAIEKGLDKVKETAPARTIAGALRVNFGAEHSITAVRKSGGFGISVSDEQIVKAQREIARDEGIVNLEPRPRMPADASRCAGLDCPRFSGCFDLEQRQRPIVLREARPWKP